MEPQFIRLKPLDAILDGYLGSFPIAHALFRGSELKMLAGRELARPALDLGCGTGQFATLVAESAVDAAAGGGTMYAVNDVLTVSGGKFTAAAKFKVTEVADGVVTKVALDTAGKYGIIPANPAATAGGAGTGCTLTITYVAITEIKFSDE